MKAPESDKVKELLSKPDSRGSYFNAVRKAIKCGSSNLEIDGKEYLISVD